MSESVTKEGIAAIALCPVPGCGYENILVIFYDEAELLARSKPPKLPPRWFSERGGGSFGPTNLRCAKCNQPLKPVFSRQEIERDLVAAETAGFLEAYHLRSARPC